MVSHLDQFHAHYGKHSQQVIADAGYGSEQNYEYLEGNGIEAFVKYNYFHKEQKKGFKRDIFHPENLFYNKEKDFYVCPMGQQMHKLKESSRKLDLGYQSQISHYKAINCNGCLLRGQCHKNKQERIIEINFRLKELKSKQGKG